MGTAVQILERVVWHSLYRKRNTRTLFKIWWQHCHCWVSYSFKTALPDCVVENIDRSHVLFTILAMKHTSPVILWLSVLFSFCTSCINVLLLFCALYEVFQPRLLQLWNSVNVTDGFKEHSDHSQHSLPLLTCARPENLIIRLLYITVSLDRIYVFSIYVFDDHCPFLADTLTLFLI